MKKVLHILGNIVTILIVAFTVFVMLFTVISFNTVGKENATFLGYKPNIVLTDSMKDEFQSGDLEISKEVDPATLQVGDIITYHSIDPGNYGEVITHKIREITTYEGGLAFTTYGTTTGVDDPYPAVATNIMGKYAFHLPKMGTFFQFLKTPTGYFTIILIPFMILIIGQAIRFFRLMRKYKAEQREVVESQRAEMESQRQQTQDMMDELARLRAQLNQEQPAAAQAAAPQEANAEQPAPAEQAAAVEAKAEPEAAPAAQEAEAPQESAPAAAEDDAHAPAAEQ